MSKGASDSIRGSQRQLKGPKGFVSEAAVRASGTFGASDAADRASKAAERASEAA